MRRQKMKKMISKLAMFFVGVLMITSFTGCSKFDASGYVKAVLDNAYLNDATELVVMGLSTEEEAMAIYNQRIESLMNVTFSTVTISEELKAEYTQFYKDLYGSVKYTVGDAVEVDDETFEVTVTCEKANIFADAVASYEERLTELVAAWTEAALAGEEVPSDEEKFEQFFVVYKDCLVAELADVVYDAPVEVVIRVESMDGMWTANQEDMLNLEYTLIDFKEMYEIE